MSCEASHKRVIPGSAGIRGRQVALGSGAGLVVCRLHVGRDPAALADGIAVGPGPLADRADIATAAALAGDRLGRLAATGTGGETDPGRKAVAQLVGIARGEVDLVADPVEGET